MTDPRRWGTDTQGTGVSNAIEAAPAVHRLLEAMADDGWVAEEPEHHLLPHLRAAAASLGVELLAAEVVEHVLVVRVGSGRPGPAMLGRWCSPSWDRLPSTRPTFATTVTSSR